MQVWGFCTVYYQLFHLQAQGPFFGILSHSIECFLYDFYIKNSRVTFLDISSDVERKNDIAFPFSLYFFGRATNSV